MSQMANQITLPVEQVAFELVPLLVLRSHIYALFRTADDWQAQLKHISLGKHEDEPSEFQTWLSLIAAAVSGIVAIVQTCIALGSHFG
ncbi:MAG: hypothetical protein ACRD3W_20595 [Terriglobales bacterium]